MKIAMYPGTFDPMTNGHLSLIRRGCEVFDQLIVAVADNTPKRPLFSHEAVSYTHLDVYKRQASRCINARHAHRQANRQGL